MKETGGGYTWRDQKFNGLRLGKGSFASVFDSGTTQTDINTATLLRRTIILAI